MRGFKTTVEVSSWSDFYYAECLTASVFLFFFVSISTAARQVVAAISSTCFVIWNKNSWLKNIARLMFAPLSLSLSLFLYAISFRKGQISKTNVQKLDETRRRRIYGGNTSQMRKYERYAPDLLICASCVETICLNWLIMVQNGWFKTGFSHCPFFLRIK